MADSPPPLASPCPNCRKRGGHYAKSCSDLPDGCWLRGVFPTNSYFYKTALDFYGPTSLGDYFEDINDEQQRIRAAQSLVRAANLFSQDPVYGPLGRYNEDYQRMQILDNLSQILGRNAILMARCYDAILERVSTHPGIISNNAEKLTKGVLDLYGVEIPEFLNEVDDKIKALLGYVQNMQPESESYMQTMGSSSGQPYPYPLVIEPSHQGPPLSYQHGPPPLYLHGQPQSYHPGPPPSYLHGQPQSYHPSPPPSYLRPPPSYFQRPPPPYPRPRLGLPPPN